MTLAIALLGAFALAGCTSVRLEIGAGYDKFVQYGGRCIAEYNHHSSITRGQPFNDKGEDLVNQWSGIISIPLWGRSP